jgi:hypothetical protein
MNVMIRSMVVTGVLLAVLVACDSNPSKSEDESSDDESSVANPFPHEVGMYWTYQVYDSLTGLTDTVEVAVVDTISGENLAPTAVRKEQRDDSVSTTYWEDRGDSVIVYHGDRVGLPKEKFVVPFTPGAAWSGPLDTDTSEVVSTNGTNTVPAGQFDDVARVDRNWNTDFEGGGSFSSTWIDSSVGIIKIHKQEQYSDGATITVTLNEVWQLLHYDLHTFGIHQYPMTVGTRWTYRVLDSLMFVIDTLVVTIVADTITPDGWPGTLWTYDYGSHVNTELVTNHTTSVQVQSSITYPTTYYDFPLAIGKLWGMHFFGLVPEIVEKGPVSVPAGDFAAGFKHRNSGSGPDYYWSADSWLVPNVGLVRRTLSVSSLGSAYVTTHWVLTEYEIAP